MSSLKSKNNVSVVSVCPLCFFDDLISEQANSTPVNAPLNPAQRSLICTLKAHRFLVRKPEMAEDLEHSLRLEYIPYKLGAAVLQRTGIFEWMRFLILNFLPSE